MAFSSLSTLPELGASSLSVQSSSAADITIHSFPDRSRLGLAELSLTISGNELSLKPDEAPSPPAYPATKEGLCALIRKLVELDMNDPKSVVELKTLLRFFQKQRCLITAFKGDGKVGGCSIKPFSSTLLKFKLTANATYRILPVWEQDLGFRLYFYREGEAISFSIDDLISAKRTAHSLQIGSENPAPASCRRWDIAAKIVGRDSDLFSLRRNPNEGLENIIRDWCHLGKASEQKRQEFLGKIERFNARSFRFMPLQEVDASEGSLNSFVSKDMTPCPGYNLRFSGLKKTLEYRLHFECYENTGLRLTLLGQNDVMRFSFDDFKARVLSGQKGAISARLVGRAAHVSILGKDARDPLESLVRLWREFELQKRDPSLWPALSKAIEIMQQGEFSIQTSAGFKGAGKCCITPFPGKSLCFNSLKGSATYLVKPHWDTVLGLRIHFMSDTEVLSFDVQSYLKGVIGTGKQAFNAQKVGRAEDLSSLSKDAREPLSNLVRLWHEVELNKENSGSFEKLSIAVESFKRQNLVIRTGEKGSDGLTQYRLMPQTKKTLIFNRLLPITVYQVKAHLHKYVGLRVYFVADKEAISFDVTPYKSIARHSEKKQEVYADQLSSAKDLVSAMQDGAGAGALCHLLLAWLKTDKTVWDDYQLAPILESIRNEGLSLTASPKGIYWLNLRQGNRLQFSGLKSGTRYEIIPYYEPTRGLVIYMKPALGQVIAYNVETLLALKGGGERKSFHAHISGRAFSLEIARRQVATNSYRRALSYQGMKYVRSVDPHSSRVVDLEQEGDALNELSNLDYGQAIRDILLEHYSLAEIEDLMLVGDLVFGGTPISEAYEQAQIPSDRLPWIKKQWSDVLPNIFKDFYCREVRA